MAATSSVGVAAGSAAVACTADARSGGASWGRGALEGREGGGGTGEAAGERAGRRASQEVGGGEAQPCGGGEGAEGSGGRRLTTATGRLCCAPAAQVKVTAVGGSKPGCAAVRRRSMVVLSGRPAGESRGRAEWWTCQPAVEKISAPCLGDMAGGVWRRETLKEQPASSQNASAGADQGGGRERKGAAASADSTAATREWGRKRVALRRLGAAGRSAGDMEMSGGKVGWRLRAQPPTASAKSEGRSKAEEGGQRVRMHRSRVGGREGQRGEWRSMPGGEGRCGAKSKGGCCAGWRLPEGEEPVQSSPKPAGPKGSSG